MTTRPSEGPIRVGIIGLGEIGRTHLDALTGCPDAEVVAVSRRRGPPTGVGAEWYEDHLDLLRQPNIDLVVICTPSGLHATHAMDALAAGKGVVIEKPLALADEDGERVVRAAREAGLFLGAISQRRLESSPRAVKAALDAGHFGRPILGEALVRWHRDAAYYVDHPWRGTRAMDGGVLMNQAIHAIDLLRWFLGPVESVTGQTGTLSHRIEAEDTAVATLRFTGGALGVVTATTATTPGLPAEVNLFCDRGLVSLHDATVARWESASAPAPPRAGPGRSGSSDPRAIGSDGHRRQWRDILDAYREGREPLVTGEDAMMTLATINAIIEAQGTGRTVRPSASSARPDGGIPS